VRGAYSAVVSQRPIAEDQEPDIVGRYSRRADCLAVVSALILITASAVVGRVLLDRGFQLVLPCPPLLASWAPHVGWGTPLAALCVLAGLRLQGAAAALSWTRLLLAGWQLNLAWMCSLTLIDGFRTGWVDVLLDPNEYLRDLPRIADPRTFISTFTHFVAFSPGVDGSNVWTTHVAAHPPLATLLFWALDRIGLGGGFWAGALCILVGSAASVAVPVVLRELGAEAAGRRAVAFVALFPGAVWMAVSADGLFAGTAVSGLALVCLGANRRRALASLAGGLLLGAAVYLSYGLVLFGLIVLVAFALTVRRCGLRPTLLPWLAATAGAVVVAAVHLVLGFDWLAGLAQLRVRYYQGIASQRPYAYFVWADLAAWLVSCSPLLAAGVVRAVTAVSRWRREDWSQERVVALVTLGGLLAALAADVSGMSKAETERIWMVFGLVTYTSVALLRGRQARVALVGAAAWALLVNHLLDTGW
jgi:methylthioxylose transferase